jgi:hypothetical protein
MPADVVDTEVAGLAVGRSSRAIRYAVRDERLRNYGTTRRVRVSLAEVLDLWGDPLGMR